MWGDEDVARYVAGILEAIDWKWTPLQVLEQPEALLHDVLVLGGLSATVRRLERENEHAGQ